jgi:TRAP-type C4-dicarboxylate transport system permease small subunit
LFLILPLIILLFPDGRLPPRWRMVLWAYLAVCALIVAILLGSGAWQMRGARIVVQGNGQLVNNPGPTGALGFAQLILFVVVPVFWAFFVARQVLSWRRATGSAGPSSSG